MQRLCACLNVPKHPRTQLRPVTSTGNPAVARTMTGRSSRSSPTSAWNKQSPSGGTCRAATAAVTSNWSLPSRSLTGAWQRPDPNSRILAPKGCELVWQKPPGALPETPPLLRRSRLPLCPLFWLWPQQWNSWPECPRRHPSGRSRPPLGRLQLSTVRSLSPGPSLRAGLACSCFASLSLTSLNGVRPGPKSAVLPRATPSASG